MEKVCLTILGAMVVPYTLAVVCSPFYYKWGIGKRFYHNMLGWHLPQREQITQIGENAKSQCRLCGREIIQDSRGNWFSY